jgi:hypothetical protein
MSLEGLFPNAGSYTGTTRSPLIGKTTNTADDSQKGSDVAVSATTTPIKMDPVNAVKSLVTDEVLSQIFTAQQDTSHAADCVNNNLAHSVTDAYAEMANKELPKSSTNVFFAA